MLLIALMPIVGLSLDSIMQDKMSEVYQQRVWERKGKFSGNGSGPGSDASRTFEVRACLLSIIKRFNITSMLDAPCGSFNWQPLLLNEVEKFRPNFQYQGFDIVPSVIESNSNRYFHKKNWKFGVADISAENWKDSFDLILTRDALFHLTYDKIFCSLNAFSRTKSRYFFATTFKDLDNYNRAAAQRVQPIRGRQLNEGGYRAINLQGAPLLLPEPIELCAERLFRRSLGLWKISSLPFYKYDANDKLLKCNNS